MRKLLIALLLVCLFGLLIPLGHSSISIYNFDSCENISEWHNVNNFTCSVHPNPKMEGSGSLKIENSPLYPYPPYNWVEGTTYINVSWPVLPINEVVGWAWRPSSSYNFNIYMGWYDNYGHYVKYGLGYAKGDPEFTIYTFSNTFGSGGLVISGPNTISSSWLDQWIWTEWNNGSPIPHAYWNGVNDSLLPIGIQAIDFNLTSFRITGVFYSDNFELYIDYLRTANGFEYPPSDPQYGLSIYAYANPGTGNASIPVQTIIDGYYYTTPISINHTAGNFTVTMAQNYGYNATHDVYFSEWTDGTLGNSRTVNFTGALSLGANYGFIRHADFGGYFNFFLGVFGLILMGGGVIALKICWDDHNFAWGLGICLACEIIGLGFCTILVGG